MKMTLRITTQSKDSINPGSLFGRANNQTLVRQDMRPVLVKMPGWYRSSTLSMVQLHPQIPVAVQQGKVSDAFHTPGAPISLNLDPPNVPLLRALWSLLDGIWGVLEGWGVLEVSPIHVLRPPR